MKISFGVPFIRVPYEIRDLKKDPNLENYPCMNAATCQTVQEGKLKSQTLPPLKAELSDANKVATKTKDWVWAA